MFFARRASFFVCHGHNFSDFYATQKADFPICYLQNMAEYDKNSFSHPQYVVLTIPP